MDHGGEGAAVFGGKIHTPRTTEVLAEFLEMMMMMRGERKG